MGFRIQGCFESICETGGDTTAFEGFALIKLITPPDAQGNAVTPYHATNNGRIRCGDIYQADVDPVTGCWTSCELICPDEIFPPGSYYEVAEFINGECCGTCIVQPDCSTAVSYFGAFSNLTPDPLGVSIEVTINAVPTVLGISAATSISDIVAFLNVNDPSGGTWSIIGNVLSVIPSGADVHDQVEFTWQTSATVNVTALVVTGLPDPTPLSALCLNNPQPGNPLLCSAFASCETPWVGVAGDGIAIVPADNPAGASGNGHMPSISVCLSTDAGNALSIGTDGCLFSSGGGGGSASITTDGTALGVTTVVQAFDITLNSTDAGQVLATGSDGGLLLTCEEIQDCIGTAIANGLGGLVYNDGADSISVLISTDAGNTITFGTDGGILSTVTAPVQSVLDTNCIDLTLAAGVLSADPILDAVSGGGDNILVCTADGLYVPPAGGAPITTVSDTDCIGLTITGTDLTADPILDAVTGGGNNALVCTPGQGLYVAPGGAVQSVSDTNCIDLTLSVGGDLSAAPVIDPAPNNTLVCGASGLLATQGTFTTDGTALGVTQVGTNTDFVLLSTDVGNSLVTGSDGGVFLAPAGAITGVVDTDCIDLTVTLGVLSADPVLDAVTGGGDNVLVCTVGQGLYVPPAPVQSVADTICIDLTLAAGVLSAQPILDPALTNTLFCGANGLIATQGTFTTDGTATGVSQVGTTTDFVLRSLDAGQLLSTGSDGGVFINAAQILGAVDLIVTDSNCINMSLSGDGSVGLPWNISAVPILDPNPNNIISCGVAGLLATETLTALASTAGSTITYTDENGANTVIDVCTKLASCSVDALSDVDTTTVAPVAGNVLVWNGTNWVPGAGPVSTVTPNLVAGEWVHSAGGVNTTIVSTSADGGNVLAIGTDGGTYLDVAGLTSLLDVAVVDTNCIDLTLTGDGSVATPWTIQADPIVDVAATNLLSCGASGMLVEVNVGDCLAGDGTVGNPLDIQLDPAVNNALVCNPAGLFVSTATAPFIQTVSDTDCINLDVTGNDLTSTIIFDAATGGGDNIAVCTAGQGLYVPPAPVQSVLDTSCIDLDLTAGVLSATPILDLVTNGGDNVAQCTANGIYVPPGGGAGLVTTVTDTNCIALDVTLGNLTADPILDPALNNLLSCGASGLLATQGTFTLNGGALGVTQLGTNTDFVTLSGDGGQVLSIGTDGGLLLTCEEVQDCIGIAIANAASGPGLVYDDPTNSIQVLISADAGNTTVFGTDGGVYTGAQISVLDTNCIDLTLAAGVLSADPIVDPDANNRLVCGASGLLVDMDGAITTDGTANGVTTTASVTDITLLSGDAGQVMSTGSDGGLLLTCEEIQDCIGDAIANAATGPGLVYNDVANSIRVLLSTDSGNQASFGTDGGVFTPAGLIGNVQSTSCIALGLVSGNILEASPIISPDADNIIECRANGLYVPDDFIRSVSDTTCIALTVDGAGDLTADPIISPIPDNSLTCVVGFGALDGLYAPRPTQRFELGQGGVLAVDGNLVDQHFWFKPGGVFAPQLNIVDAWVLLGTNHDQILTIELGINGVAVQTINVPAGTRRFQVPAGAFIANHGAGNVEVQERVTNLNGGTTGSEFVLLVSYQLI